MRTLRSPIGERGSGGDVSTDPLIDASRPGHVRTSTGSVGVLRIGANLVGAAGAAIFAKDSLQVYLHTHRWLGAAFAAEQCWIVVAYLIRRRARVVSRRVDDWLLAFAGTFGGVLFRPVGVHSHWGVATGFVVQAIGLAICIAAFLSLGRSFGFAAADRGIVRRGPYRFVRHPIYASYFLLQCGYVLQSASVRNVLVLMFVTSCNVGRALAEERLLVSSSEYVQYRARVHRRLIPGLW